MMLHLSCMLSRRRSLEVDSSTPPRASATRHKSPCHRGARRAASRLDLLHVRRRAQQHGRHAAVLRVEDVEGGSCARRQSQRYQIRHHTVYQMLQHLASWTDPRPTLCCGVLQRVFCGLQRNHVAYSSSGELVFGWFAAVPSASSRGEW